jgi:hypothetical protein
MDPLSGLNGESDAKKAPGDFPGGLLHDLFPTS